MKLVYKPIKKKSRGKTFPALWRVKIKLGGKTLYKMIKK